jgi:hypothetical protein
MERKGNKKKQTSIEKRKIYLSLSVKKLQKR